MTKHVFEGGRPGGRRGARTLNATAYSHFIAALLDRAMTRPALQEATGMGPVLTSQLIKALRARGQSGEFNSVLHIESWALDARGYPTLQAFRLGPGLDAPQPKKSRTQVVRDYLERKAKRMTRPKRKATNGVNHELLDSRIDRMLAAGS